MRRAHTRRLVFAAIPLLIAGLCGGVANGDERPPWARAIGGPTLSEQGRARITRDTAEAKQAGFIDRASVPSPLDDVLREARDDESKTQAMIAGRTQSVRRRYLALNEVLEKRAPMRLAALPASLLRGNSENFIAVSKGRTVRVYSDTALGALMVREVAGAALQTVGDRKPDVSISGTPVFLSTVKYAGSRWVTEAVAGPPGRVVHVFFGTQIDTAEKSALMQSVLAALLAS